jgi:hypothetical protein
MSYLKTHTWYGRKYTQEELDEFERQAAGYLVL